MVAVATIGPFVLSRYPPNERLVLMTITITKTKLAIALVALALLVPATAFDTHSFSDVHNGQYYTDAVEWAAANGITTGYGDGTFRPDEGVTRGQNVTFAHRYDTNIVQPALDDINNDIATLPDIYTIKVKADSTKDAGSFGTSVTSHTASTGIYELDWPTDIDDCVWQATIAQKASNFISFSGDNGELSLQNDFDFNGFAFLLDPDGMVVGTAERCV